MKKVTNHLNEEQKPGNQQENDFPAGLSNPARRALSGAGYMRLEQLSKVSEAELKQLHGLGPKGIVQLRQALEAIGLDFADKQSDSKGK